MKKQPNEAKGIKLAVNFLGLEPESSAPPVALYLLDNSGRATKKLAKITKGQINIPAELQKLEANIALGPDVEQPQELERQQLLQYRAATALETWRAAGRIELPDLRWRDWIPLRSCVSGNARKCRIIITPGFPRPWPIPDVFPITEIAPRPLQIPNIQIKCEPMCYGIVEVYRRICCCDPWILIPRLPDLIPELIERIPIPLPDPPPFVPPIRRLQAKAIKLQEANLEPARRQVVDDRVVRELRSLQQLNNQQAQYDFLIARPHLIPILCRNRECTTFKVGETQLGPDGSFTYCFPLFLTRVNCTVSYTYKIKQWIGGQYVYVYDGEAAQDYFSPSELAELKTFNPQAETCNQPDPPVDGQGQPFVMLQNIGTTDTYRLHSPKQNSNNGLNQPLPANVGLMDQNYSTDCPLGGTLDLLLYIDPDMRNTSARYYRFSLVAANASGNPQAGATPEMLVSGVSWRKFVAGTFPPQIEAEALGPQTVNGTEGLFRIPYVDANNRWLSNQYHYRLDTTQKLNGKYLLKLELFNANGELIRPQAAPGPGQPEQFHYLWWKDANRTETVEHNSLIHLLHFDNVKCYGDIVDLRKNGIANTADCQFTSGPANSQFSAGFRAYHRNDFMLRYRLDYFRGLNGSDIVLDTGTTNQPPTKNLGLPAQSASASFAAMLGNNAVGTKCTFTLDLYVWAKHTNGRSRIQGYDSSDEASFALEIV